MNLWPRCRGTGRRLLVTAPATLALLLPSGYNNGNSNHDPVYVSGYC